MIRNIKMTSDNYQLPELETVPKPAAVIESVALLSLGLAVLSLFLFAWIAESVSHDQTRQFDMAVRQAVHQHSSPAMTKAMFAASFIGGNGLVIAAVLAMILFLSLRWRRAALWLLTTILGALVLDLALKYAFHRPRPTPFFGNLPRTPSFPSGHALFSFCFYGVLAGLLADRIRSLWLRILIWACAAILVAAIGLSRIYLGVHYPSDVIAGYLTATLWVSTMIVLDHVRAKRKLGLPRPGSDSDDEDSGK
ncbi:MAG TPA: phosphatase PAP2 family protein [Terriglobales bacterium]|nr:phosphatase PAP2 family protein [Terriglobales bacterium]